jgi:hydrogenase 3 maturation protease
VIRGDAVQAAVAEWVCSDTLVMGIGNPLRGDDAAGPMICAQLGSQAAVDCGDAPERYLGLAGRDGIRRVLLVDAMDFGGAPGEIAFCVSGELVERFGTTHDSGLAVLAHFMEQEYGTPVAVLGIQPTSTEFGARVSAAVQSAVVKVSAWLRRAIPQHCPGEMEAAWTRS